MTCRQRHSSIRVYGGGAKVCFGDLIHVHRTEFLHLDDYDPVICQRERPIKILNFDRRRRHCLRRARRGLRTGSARPASGKPPDPHLPFALLENSTKGLRIAAANDPARQLGITEGLVFTDARARVPNLVTEDMDPVADSVAAAEQARLTAAWLD